MNPELKNLQTMQMTYDTLLNQYNQDLSNFLQEMSKYDGDKAIRREQRKMGRRIKRVQSRGKDSVNDLKLHKNLLFSEDSLVRAIFNLKNRKDLFEIYPNTVYWGKRYLSQGMADSVNDCLIRCQANTKCTGAWFQQGGPTSQSGLCQLRAGPGAGGRRDNRRSAIMNKLVVLLSKIKETNARLLQLNDEISGEILNATVNVDTLGKQNQAVNEKMASDHLTLVAQKEILDDRIRDYTSTKVSDIETDRLATQHLLVYRLYIVILLIALYIPIVITYGTPRPYIALILLAGIFLILNAKMIALYLLIATIIYLAFLIPLEKPI